REHVELAVGGDRDGAVPTQVPALQVRAGAAATAVVLDAQRLRWRTDVAGGGDESLQHGASAPGFTTALLVEQFGFGRGVGAAALGPVTHRSTVGTSDGRAGLRQA